MALLARPLRSLPAALLASVLAFACTPTSPTTEGSTTVPQRAAQASGAGAQTADASGAAPSASAKRAAEAEAKRFASLVDDLSEPDTYFFSDNLITNETSFLQVAEDLQAQAPPGSVYLGVGPEQ